MPRKAFNADLASAVGASSHPTGISAVRRGDDDGWVTFTLTPEAVGSGYLVTAMVTDVADYPSSHAFFLSAEDDMPTALAQTLGHIQEQLSPGTPILQLLSTISSALCKDQNGDSPMGDVNSLQGLDVSDDELEGYSSDLKDDDDDDPTNFDLPSDDDVEVLQTGHVRIGSSPTYQTLDRASRCRLRNDLALVKKAGFRVGHLGPLLEGDSSYLSISCRVSKLGISGEAMQAWQVQPEEYVTLLIQYPSGYVSVEEVKTYNNSASAQGAWQFRTGIGSSYKPSPKEIVQAFAARSNKAKAMAEEGESSTRFRKLFISSALDDLFQEKFIMLLKYRLKGMHWDGAMKFLSDLRERDRTEQMSSDKKYTQLESVKHDLPRLVTADHISDAGFGAPLSLPLVAMQFLMRHFVRCTEFCLVCHRKMPDGLEAIKPYVCDGELCLFQYMQLGLGPSIEHEIITQPRVIDLLISLCYVSAKQLVLQSRLPKGIKGKAPPLSVLKPYPDGQNVPVTTHNQPSLNNIVRHPMKYHPVRSEMMFGTEVKAIDLGFTAGDWVAIKVANSNSVIHCKVDSICLPVVFVSKEQIIVVPSVSQDSINNNLSVVTKGDWKQTALNIQSDAAAHVEGLNDCYNPADCILYSVDFDSLPDSEKCMTIQYILELLPSVSQMRDYLTSSMQADLKNWTSRMCPLALGIVRWIIASNRACIMQIDGPKAFPLDRDSRSKSSIDERVGGMPGWLQFKFAMGAPEKERRFTNCVKSMAVQHKLKHPTMFAWHGSPLANWHSIIRESFNFNQIAHGRAYGNGVYFAMDCQTSLGYSGNSYHTKSNGTWPLSELDMVNAISLNELINAPGKFVSHQPHLVVDNLDWMQTRYLFVQRGTGDHGSVMYETQNASTESVLGEVVDQDPIYTPKGPNHSRLAIPITALPGARRQTSHSVHKGYKKVKVDGTVLDPIMVDDDDDHMSITSDEEDIMLLVPEPDTDKENVKPQTDFVPGKLDRMTLPMLKPPEGSAASISASKRLQQDFKSVLSIQNREPAHELGWYIDPELMMETNNLYQWIVELHSFEPHLPLTQDMKAQGINSIVLELRFSKDYPISPPFVRVIRPRFLTFLQGGGGHVTAGGALCMQLLTNDGWSAVSSIESVLLQVRLAMSSTEPKPARLEPGQGYGRMRDYSTSEAVQAYIRACRMHGWKVPDGFEATMMNSMSQSAF
ncbi:uncharacterized protein K452DRAFT_301349 [Aplosporella prunicola CBS 121167]|uniref:UBC core domain-containing protein n=1 Tax=Aplosporella prunicola CBS 121167 TaxID=1176127 RepID=A0A6A6B5D6_9PEZI|nr:uncharacterized protein K452DRAFT_301349 [Aplosporella prunicola CBS 121167]KAF2137961.1 hypothetical protein K452DRAFT_301349 [Aplosporella prunicola CBS 121167]